MSATLNLDKYIRPSSLGAIALCEGRPTMEAHVVQLDGEPPASEVATLGHDLHARAQHCIEGWKTGEDWARSILWETGNAEDQGVDSWSIYCLRAALETVRDLVAKHGIQPDNVLTEQRLDMASLGFPQGGTADVILVIPGDLVVVIDFKFGFVDQGEAADHDQLQAYAAAASETYTASRVLVVLLQPRAEKANRITQARFDADALRANRSWTMAVINLARGNNPRLTAGYSQCQFCRALPRCPEARKYIMDAKEALEIVGKPLDAAGFGALADAAKLADKFAETGKDIAKERLSAGLGVSGWKLGTPRAIRTVTDVPRALARLESAGYGAELGEALSLSLSKLTPTAAAVIDDQIAEKLSSPPLTQDKKGKG